MTRLIKFRAWHKATKTIIIDVGVLPLGGVLELTGSRKVGNVGAIEKNYTYYNPDLVEIMQFTGLLDKNGKEIYEGDILSSEYPVDGNKNCHPVVWRESRGCWVVDHSINDCCKAWRGDLGGHHMSEEIIGNVWENPELIK